MSKKRLVNQRRADESGQAGDLGYVPPPGAEGQSRRQRPAPPAALPPGNAERGQQHVRPADPEPVPWDAPPAGYYEAVPIDRGRRDGDTAARRPARRHERDPAVYRPRHISWGQQLLLEVLLYACSWTLWGVNAFMTILGLIWLGLPNTLLGVIIGMLIHIVITLGERYFIVQGGLLVLGLGLILATIDIGTNIAGLTQAVALWQPEWIAGLPANPLIWLQEAGIRLWQLLNSQEISPAPVWTAAAFALTLGATAIALLPEQMVRRTRRRVAVVWRQRPASVTMA
jgi:hypothetical protein